MRSSFLLLPSLTLASALLLSCRFGLDNPVVGDGGFVVPPGCGDGVVDTGEQCDDGNFDNDDICLENCRLAVCGDGVVRASVEECDDGNDDELDGCTTTCTVCPAVDEVDALFVSPTTQHCYTRNQAANEFNEAEAQCKLQGGSLAALSTLAEHTEVTAGLPVTEPSWIGFRFTTAGWVWTFLEPEAFTNWAVGFPDAQNLTLQLANGEWQTTANTPYPFLCEIKPDTTWSIRPGDGHAYMRSKVEVSWDVAKAECEVLGAHLVTIESAEEAVFIRDALGSSPLAWIGVSSPEGDGNFVTVSGDALSFTDWAPDEPSGNGNCARIGVRWDDAPCDDSRQFICEQE